MALHALFSHKKRGLLNNNCIWWLNQPIWKKIWVKLEIFPQIGGRTTKKIEIWNHHLEKKNRAEKENANWLSFPHTSFSASTTFDTGSKPARCLRGRPLGRWGAPRAENPQPWPNQTMATQLTLQGTDTYPAWGKGKSSSNTPYQGDVLISWRVSHRK